MITVRPATPADSAEWLRMRLALWDEDSADWHAAEIEQFFAGRLREPLQALLASDPNHHGKPLTKDEAAKALALIGS